VENTGFYKKFFFLRNGAFFQEKLRISKERGEKEVQISVFFIFFSENFNEVDKGFGFKAEATPCLPWLIHRKL
jgi:hypothetical protein